MNRLPSIDPGLRPAALPRRDESDRSLKDELEFLMRHVRKLRSRSDLPGSLASLLDALIQAATPGSDRSTVSAKVLIIDDSEAIRETVRRSLEEHGVAVITSDSPTCVPLIMQEEPDLILLDIEMPGIPGDVSASVFARNAELLKGARLVLYSSLPDHRLQSLVNRSGAHGFISKSLDRTRFVQEVRTWLSRVQR